MSLRETGAAANNTKGQEDLFSTQAATQQILKKGKWRPPLSILIILITNGREGH